jgi:hypothetical protein
VGVDVVVDVGGEVGRMGGVLESMAGRGGGCVLSVVGESEREDEVVSMVKEASHKCGKSALNWNVLVSRGKICCITFLSSGWDVFSWSGHADVISDSNHRFVLDKETKEKLEAHIREYHSER